MSKQKIKVELCHDHFQRLCEKTTCDSCPSNLENESVVRTMGEVVAADRDVMRTAIVTELKIIRRSQDDLRRQFEDRLTRLEHLIKGNGTTGIQGRIDILETRMESRGKSITLGVTVVGVIISVLISVFTLVAELGR